MANYFRKEHEDAIVAYVAAETKEEQERLYREYLNPVFTELIAKIVTTYRFASLPNIDILKEECKVDLMGILDKYNPEKAKAFSYFTKVVLNWFSSKRKYINREIERTVDSDSINELKEGMFEEENYITIREHRELWEYILEELNDWEEEAKSDRDVRVIKAIRVIMNNIGHLTDEQDFHKKKVRMAIREISLLDSRVVSQSMSRIRKWYRSAKDKWDNGEI